MIEKEVETMGDAISVMEKLREIFDEVGSYIFEHWYAFLVLTVLLVITIIKIYGFVNERQKRNLETQKDAQDARQKYLEYKEVEIDKKMNKYKELENVIDSGEYKAYMVANKLTGEDLDDSNMFAKRKRFKKNNTNK